MPRTPRQQARFDAATRRQVQEAQDRHRRIENARMARYLTPARALERAAELRGHADALVDEARAAPFDSEPYTVALSRAVQAESWAAAIRAEHTDGIAA